MSLPDANDVVSFWRAAGPARWFRADASFDRLVGLRLGRAHKAATEGRLDHWLLTVQGALALLVLLDQAPRNLFRGTARAFATDAQARAITRLALDRGWDKRVPRSLRGFFYLPLMHSEDLADQEECCRLYRAMGDLANLKWAVIHRDIINEFGRFPHRNAMLGRETTAKEQTFLDSGGFRG
jgi:uncharacterized protein (DUF924 family)